MHLVPPKCRYPTNQQIWDDENPRFFQDVQFKQQFATDSWAGIYGDLVGPYEQPPNYQKPPIYSLYLNNYYNYWTMNHGQ
jgi:hypothetical protein